MPASSAPVGGDGATGRRWRANPVPPVPPGRQRTSQRVTRWACPPPHPGYDFPGCSVGRTRYRPRSHRASLLISHASNRLGSFSLPVGLPCVPAMAKAWRTFVQVGKSIRKLSPTNLHHCRADKARCTESSCPACETPPPRTARAARQGSRNARIRPACTHGQTRRRGSPAQPVAGSGHREDR